LYATVARAELREKVASNHDKEEKGMKARLH
jgi:hypothetical protein